MLDENDDLPAEILIGARLSEYRRLASHMPGKYPERRRIYSFAARVEFNIKHLLDWNIGEMIGDHVPDPESLARLNDPEKHLMAYFLAEIRGLYNSDELFRKPAQANIRLAAINGLEMQITNLIEIKQPALAAKITAMLKVNPKLDVHGDIQKCEFLSFWANEDNRHILPFHNQTSIDRALTVPAKRAIRKSLTQLDSYKLTGVIGAQEKQQYADDLKGIEKKIGLIEVTEPRQKSYALKCMIRSDIETIGREHFPMPEPPHR